MKNIPFNGILAVGDTQRQATDNYRRLALGQDVAAFRDEGGSLSFISNSSSAPNVMFNPKTGDVDVVRDDSIISQVSFASESSDEEVYPHHAVCSDGCGKHVVYDSVSSVQFCPMCTCSLAPASESGEDCTDDDGNQMNDESELESESESAAEDEAMELLDGIESDEDSDEGEGEDLESESADDEEDDEDDGGEDPEEEPEDDDEDDLSDLDDEDDELDGEEDDGETSESSDGDGVVCASASKASAIKMFLKESNTSLSADQTVGVEYVVCSSDSCGAHIVHNTASLTACPVCLSSVEEPEGELDGELDLDAEDEGHDFDMEDDDLESESADGGDDDEDDLSDLDLDDGEEDEDSEDDEDAADTDGDSPSESSDSMTTKTAVSFSRAGAQARYVQINGLGSSLSADATVEAEYVVCSSDSCGAHIVSESRAEFCPVCASETVDPDTSEDESSVTEEKSEEEVETTGADKAAEIMGNLGAEEKPEEPETKPEADEPAAAEGDAPDAGAEEKSEEDEMDASESTDIDALALVDDSQPDAAAKLDVSYSSNVAGASAWTAFYEGKPVAMARVADAGKNADLFDKPAFGQAALSAARQIGVKTVLRDLGFKPLVHSVPVTTSLSKMVEERVAAERESLSATAKQHSERFQAALATAAIGINRGFFKGVANPLKSALCSAMADAGMRNPEALVDSVFSRNFEQFSKIAHAKAEEILQRPPEVQESLASAVLDVCYKSESSSQDGAGLESKLSSIGVSVSSGAGAIQNNNKQQPVVTAGPQVSTSSSFDEDLSLALGTLGATRR